VYETRTADESENARAPHRLHVSPSPGPYCFIPTAFGTGQAASSRNGVAAGESTIRSARGTRARM